MFEPAEGCCLAVKKERGQPRAEGLPLVRALDHGEALVGLVIPPRFAEDFAAGRAVIQIVFDGTDSNTATVARGYAERLVQAYARRLEGAARGAPASSPPGAAATVGIALDERAWFNPGLVSRHYNVPAVAGGIVFLMCLLLTALAVVRERELGTLEQLMVSPLRPFELIAGKTLPFMAIGLIDVLLVTAAALWWFEVPFAGSFALLLGASLLYIVCGLGIGLLVSTISRSQQEAFLTSFLIFMPTILLSGLMFPISSMPTFFQGLTLVNPMRHDLEIVRGIFLKGTGVAVLWPQIAALAAIGALMLGAAVARFRKWLD